MNIVPDCPLNRSLPYSGLSTALRPRQSSLSATDSISYRDSSESKCSDYVCGVFSHKRDICITHGVGGLSGSRRIGMWIGGWGGEGDIGMGIGGVWEDLEERWIWSKDVVYEGLTTWEPQPALNRNFQCGDPHTKPPGVYHFQTVGELPCRWTLPSTKSPFLIYRTPGALEHACNLRFGDGPSDVLMKRAFLLQSHLPAFSFNSPPSVPI